MAGGTWTAQNKVRPGMYINTESSGQSLVSQSDRGTLSMPLPLSWGEAKKILTINSETDLFTVLGYNITDSQMLLVREALKRAKTLLLYRLNTGVKATATIGTLTATAKYGGLRGNNIKIVIQSNIDDASKFDVSTYVDTKQVDLQQAVANIAGLVGNSWVVFSGTGSLTTTAGVPLTGGTDGTTTNADHTDYLAALELFEFQTVGYPGTDTTLKGVYTSFVRRMREDEGKKVQAVLENYTIADYEGVISVKNGVILADGTTLTAAQAVAWVAAATAAAKANEALTSSAYDGAVDVSPRYKNTEIIAALNAGEFVFVTSGGKAVVEQDINTFKSFTVTKGKVFRKNRTLRAIDSIETDWSNTYNDYHKGKTDNNADGRNLFRKDCVKIAQNYRGMNAIQNFNAKTDITVLPGDEADAIYVEANIQPVDAIEKVYMKVRVM